MAISEKKMKEFFRSALDKMFMEVGFSEFDEEFAKQDEWYLKREWSEDQERQYRNWFYNECRTKLRMRKKQAELETSYFLLMWSWKTKYIDQQEKTLDHEEHQINENV